MYYLKCSLQLGFIVLALAMSGCAPAMQNPASSPTAVPTGIAASMLISTPTSRIVPSPTATFDPNDIPPELLFTPTPDPNAVSISAEIEQEYSQEEIARILFTKWLDHFLGENISPVKRLDEYTIDEIRIPSDQKCAQKSGGIFVANVLIVMKTTLPLMSTIRTEHSDWGAGGGNSIDSYHQTKPFSGVIYQSGNNYTLEVIMQSPMCD